MLADSKYHQQMSNQPKSINFSMRRLGRHHFAHLRSVAEGLPVQDCAKRYLGVEHGHAAKAAHQLTVDAVRSIARRSGEKAWRLIGIAIQIQPASSSTARPSLEEFIDSRGGLDGWNENEILEMYADEFPVDGKAARRLNLRERQTGLLKSLENLVAETPKSTDMVSDWFDETTSTKLISAGIVTLGQLNAKVSTGGRWYSALPFIGTQKAARIAAHLNTLLPPLAPVQKKQFLLADDSLSASSMPSSALQTLPGNLVFEVAQQRPIAPRLLRADTDQESVQAWINARAGSDVTVRTYRREAKRLMLWMQYEAGGVDFAGMTVNDCMDYMAFLQNVPANWISRERASPGDPGWAPFRGPLSQKSYRQSVVIISSMFAWLQSAQYLTGNPWVLLNTKTGDDPTEAMLDTKALSETAMLEIHKYLDAEKPSPSIARFRFILQFVSSVGLRSAELLGAKVGDVRLEPEGWMMKVTGKGAKNRICVIPLKAYLALQEYLAVRGLGGLETAPPDAPLLASVLDPMKPVGYQALYEHVKGLFRTAIAESDLPSAQRSKLAGASTHWLRHTFGTRAVQLEVPLDVIQAQLGHASIQTTMNIYGRAPIRRRADEIGKAFG